MQEALAQKGTHVSLRIVYRTMSEAGLIHRPRRPHGITKAYTETQNRENEIVNNTWHISNKDYEAKRATATAA